MKDNHIKEKLLSYYYDNLKDSESNIIEDHLKKCPECQREYKLIQYKMEIFDMDEEIINRNKFLDTKMLAIIRDTYNNRNLSPKKRILSFHFGFGFAALLLIAASLFTYHKLTIPQTSVARISKDIYLNDRMITENIKRLPKKSKFRIPSGTSAEIESKNYKISLYEDTLFNISRKSHKNVNISMEKGSALFDVNKNNVAWKIETINSVIKITGTKFFLKVNPDKIETTISMENGSIIAWNKNNPEKVIQAKKGDILLFQYDNIKNISPSSKEIISKKDQTPDNIKDKIYLRNGKIIVGSIVNRSTNEIKIKTKDGVIQLKNSDIEKMGHTNFLFW